MIDKCILVPVSHHYKSKKLESDKDRINMLWLSIKSSEDYKDFEVSTHETDKDEWINTMNSMKELNEKYPKHNILYLCGADKIKEFTKWKQIHRKLQIITKFCRIVCYQRDGESYDKEIAKYLEIEKKIIDVDANSDIVGNASSTAVRTFIKDNKSATNCSMLCNDVVEYINSHSLYL
jgi:nicotinate-nucleotide adenylyltransferase